MLQLLMNNYATVKHVLQQSMQETSLKNDSLQFLDHRIPEYYRHRILNFWLVS